jgi:hypothetical protein
MRTAVFPGGPRTSGAELSSVTALLPAARSRPIQVPKSAAQAASAPSPPAYSRSTCPSTDLPTQPPAVTQQPSCLPHGVLLACRLSPIRIRPIPLMATANRAATWAQVTTAAVVTVSARHRSAMLGRFPGIQFALPATPGTPPARLPPPRHPQPDHFDKLIQILVFGGGYRRIADHVRSYSSSCHDAQY